MIAGILAGLPVPAVDPPPGRGLQAPHVIIHGGTATPTARRTSGHAPARRRVWRLLCVSNTIEGARAVADLVCNLLDGAPLPDGSGIVTVVHVSSPIEDRDDPGDWRWSSTVEAIHY